MRIRQVSAVIALFLIPATVYFSHGIASAAVSFAATSFVLIIVELFAKFIGAELKKQKLSPVELRREYAWGLRSWVARIGAFLGVLGIAGFLTALSPRMGIENARFYCVAFGFAGVFGFVLLVAAARGLASKTLPNGPENRTSQRSS